LARGPLASWARLASAAAPLLLVLAVGAGLSFSGWEPLPLAGAAVGTVGIGTLTVVGIARWWAAPHRELLERNVASLERTNQDLVQARAEVVRATRLASVGTLAAGIAHEIGNPLGAVMAYVDVARTRAARGETSPEILDSIREEAARIDRIVRSLLDYARPREDADAPVAPGAAVARVRELLETQGRLDGVEVSWQVGPGTPDVPMDAQRLEQVLLNLLLNALDAMAGSVRPALVVRTYGAHGEIARLPSRRGDDPPGVNYLHRRRVGRSEGGGDVDPVFVAERVAVLEVTDNGPGIPEEELDRVFDPFFTTKEPGKGTGLGLSICARLVEGMGGRIEAGHAPNGGARFIIRLPAAPEPVVRTPSESSHEASGHR